MYYNRQLRFEIIRAARSPIVTACNIALLSPETNAATRIKRIRMGPRFKNYRIKCIN